MTSDKEKMERVKNYIQQYKRTEEMLLILDITMSVSDFYEDPEGINEQATAIAKGLV